LYLLVVLALVLPGCTGGTGTGPAEEGEGGETAIAVTAEQLTREYSTDEKAAEAKYQGKTIAVEGVVHHVNTPEPPFDVAVVLTGFNPDEPDVMKQTSVVCTLRNRGDADKVAEGQKVKLQGLMGSLMLNTVSVGDCVILEVGPAPAAPTPPGTEDTETNP
jgi:hypothetical protein